MIFAFAVLVCAVTATSNGFVNNANSPSARDRVEVLSKRLGGWKFPKSKTISSAGYYGKHMCTGILISERHVLAVIECLYEINASNGFKDNRYEVWIPSCDGALKYHFQNINVHYRREKFNHPTQIGFGLIFLREKVIMSPQTLFAKLTENPVIPSGKKVTVVGFRSDSSATIYTAIIIDQDVCSSLYKFHYSIHQDYICIDTIDKKDRTDMGDVMISDGQVVGIEAYHSTNSPSIFIGLSNYITDIEKEKQTLFNKYTNPHPIYSESISASGCEFLGLLRNICTWNYKRK